MTWSIFTDHQLQPTSNVLAHKAYRPEGGWHRRGADGQFVMRREVWQTLDGFRPWRCGADTEFSKRARLAGFTCHVFEQFLYRRRSHQQSLTVAPDTNFESPYRLCVQKLTKKYAAQYEAGKRHLAIKPISVTDYDYFESKDN